MNGPEHSAETGLAKARDVLPDGRIDHRGHLSDELVGDGTSSCLDCSTDDDNDPWITWTIPYDVDGKPMPKDWRDLPYAEVLRLCGMTSVVPPATGDAS